MICLENIIKQYQDNIVLDNISLCIDKKQMIALAGISGCGKTSLIKILAGVDSAYSGNYLFCNESFSDMNDKKQSEIRANTIGYIPQDIYLMEQNTIRDNVALSYYTIRINIRQKACCPA